MQAKCLWKESFLLYYVNSIVILAVLTLCSGSKEVFPTEIATPTITHSSSNLSEVSLTLILLS